MPNARAGRQEARRLPLLACGSCLLASIAAFTAASIVIWRAGQRIEATAQQLDERALWSQLAPAPPYPGATLVREDTAAALLAERARADRSARLQGAVVIRTRDSGDIVMRYYDVHLRRGGLRRAPQVQGTGAAISRSRARTYETAERRVAIRVEQRPSATWVLVRAWDLMPSGGGSR
jgi:hypothetical protein